MSGNLGRYLIWQCRDFVRERGIAVLLIGVVFGMTVIAPMKMAAAASATPMSDRMARQLLMIVLMQLSFIASFIVLNGLVSNDRKTGYYRFLFSKPVSLPAYYTQAFGVYFLGYLVVFALLLALFVVFVSPVQPFGPLAFAAIVFLSLGGIAFFISSLFRRDWVVLGGVLAGSQIISSVWGEAPGIRGVIARLFPPFGRLGDVMEGLVNRGTVEPQSLVWLLGYSAVFFVGGLIVLRRRPIG